MDGRFSGSAAATPEMHEGYMCAALLHLIGRDGGIEAAAKETSETSGGVRGQAAGAGDSARINEDGTGSYFQPAS